MSFQFGNTLSLIWKKLKKGDYTVKPFPIFKRWEVSTATGSQSYFANSGISIYKVLYPENHRYFGKVANLSSSLYTREVAGQLLDPKLLWYYLDHNYYTDHLPDKTPTVVTDTRRVTYLAESSSMMSIPQSIFGEGIKPSSFDVSNISATASLNYRIMDDGHGNLIDANMSTTNFVSDDYLLFNVGFNEKYREYNMRNKLVNTVLDMSTNTIDVVIQSPKNISYIPGISTTDTSDTTGTAISLNGGYLQLPTSTKFNFAKSSNFAFSFWINPPVSQSIYDSPYTPLFNKNMSYDVDVSDNNTRYVSTVTLVKPTSQFPFDIEILNQSSSTPRKIRFRQGSGDKIVEVLSNPITSSVWNHILCQKSASIYQVWVNGVLHTSTTGSITNNTTNNYNMFIGSNGTTSSIFNGSLDEIRAYSSALTSTQISTLATNTFANGYAYQTNRIGNVFYKQGIALISDTRPKYKSALLGKNSSTDYTDVSYGFSGSFRGTTTFFEHEIICKIRKSEYNFTQNPSIRMDKDPNSQVIENYATSSYFNPYVTTIGLYNDSHDLVAIAKLSSPLEKRDDVDMNIIVKFDV